MQRATVNLCNHDESQILGATNYTIPSPSNNSLGGLFLPQKSIIDVLKAIKCQTIDLLYKSNKVLIIDVQCQ